MTPGKHEFEMTAKLPVSINDFETMRRDGYLYVDKTQLIHRLVTQGRSHNWEDERCWRFNYRQNMK